LRIRGSAVPLSRDPEARARQLANLRPPQAAPLGNRRTVKHGAYAAITQAELDAEVRALMDAIGADLPVREADGGGVPAADAIPLRLLAETLIRRARIRDTELRRGIENEDGKLRGVVQYGLALDGQAIKLCEQLGLTPRSRIALGLDIARARSASERTDDALERLRQRGADIIEAREANGVG
jgi:hypothetical protein